MVAGRTVADIAFSPVVVVGEEEALYFAVRVRKLFHRARRASSAREPNRRTVQSRLEVHIARLSFPDTGGFVPSFQTSADPSQNPICDRPLLAQSGRSYANSIP
jgi:hypothetical protein